MTDNRNREKNSITFETDEALLKTAKPFFI